MSEPRALAFLRQLLALDQALHVASKRMTRQVGVTGQQRLVIRLIGRHPAITPGELARRMHLHPSTLTEILERLERGGLVKRQRDAADGRQVRLTLSAGGRRLDRSTAGTIEAAIAHALATVKEADLEAAGRVHATLTAGLHGICARRSLKTASSRRHG